MLFTGQCRRRPWKTRCGFRKKNTARSPPCWRRRRRSLTPLSTLREGRHSSRRSSASGLLLHRERGVSLGCVGDARPRGVHRASAAGRSVAGKDRSANLVAEPRNLITGGSVAGAVGAERSARAARSRARPGAAFPAWSSRGRSIELFLLSCNSTDERSDGDHPAIYGASVGIAVYDDPRSATAVVAQKRGGGIGGDRVRACGRLCRLGRLPHG